MNFLNRDNSKVKVQSLICPLNPEHGEMTLSTTSLKFIRGFGNYQFPIDLFILNIPAYICTHCAKENKQTSKILPGIDESIQEKIIHPIKQTLEKSLRNYGYSLPSITIDFKSVQNLENNQDLFSQSRSEALTNNAFKVIQPNRNLDQVILPSETRESLLRSLSLIENEDLIFNEWGLDNVLGDTRQFILNFYGSPGTGKTLTAEALAHKLGKKFLKVNYSQLESKWVGETPKNIQYVFRLAEEENALLFFDEADSFLGKRLTNIEHASDYAVNVTRSVMLMEIEKFKGVAIFATNLIGNYDQAFGRRFMLSVNFVPPQDIETLVKLWQIHLPSSLPLSDDVNLEEISSQCLGLTGGDIKNIVLAAVLDAASRDIPKSEKKVDRQILINMINECVQAKEVFSPSVATQNLSLKSFETGEKLQKNYLEEA